MALSLKHHFQQLPSSFMSSHMFCELAKNNTMNSSAAYPENQEYSQPLTAADCGHWCPGCFLRTAFVFLWGKNTVFS